MDLLPHALRAAGAPLPDGATTRRSLVVAGGGGALGSALLEQLLGSRAFAPLRVLVTRDFHASVQGLEPQRCEDFAAGSDSDADAGIGTDTGTSTELAELAIVVFDRERHANGRDKAFLRPRPGDLPALAAWLRRRQVRDLLIVSPHDAALLPQALKAGLASLDEQAVATLGFEHVLLLRSAQPPADAGNRGLQRLADLVLAQLRLMTPQNLQPVRATKVAQLVLALARQLGSRPAGTRVMPPELVWQAAQADDAEAFARAWLDGAALPAPRLRVPRM